MAWFNFYHACKKPRSFSDDRGIINTSDEMNGGHVF